MPRVPTYDTPQVAPQTGPAPYRQPAAIDNQASARQMGAAGAALQDAGAQLTQEEVNAQAMANQVMVDSARNDLIAEKQRLTFDPNDGFANKLGRDALAPDPLGRPLAQRYSEQLQDKINSLSADLGNDAQRRVFNQEAAEVATQFGGQVQQHMLQQFRNLGQETQEGTIRLATDAAKQNWSDPKQVSQQILSASSALYKLGLINGEPANLTEAKIKDTTSAIHTGVIAAALGNSNPLYAQQYLEANKGAMTADDILKVTGLVSHTVDGQVARGAVETAKTKFATQIQPTDLDRLTNIVKGMESGGDPNAVGPNVQGQGTAKGAMQVMDATNRNPGYGVTPAKDDSPEERARVGRDYLAAMVKQYGNPAQAMAAYNAGPGRLEDAIAAAKKAGAPQNWLSYLPQETQDYVQKGMTKLGTGGGAQPFPTESQFVQTAVAALGANPRIEQVQLTRQQAVAEYAMMDKSRKEEGENVTLAAQQWLIKNNGSMAAMPPDLKAAVIQHAPDKYDNLMDFAKKIAIGGTATNMNAYYDAVSNTDELAKMPDSVFNHFVMTNFSPEDGKHIAELRQLTINGNENNSGPGGLNRPALNTALNSRLAAISINPTPNDLAGKARVGAIQKFVTDGIFAQQKQLGRKMTAQEVSDFVDSTMSKNVTFRTTFLGATGTTQQNLMSMKVGDIPSDSLSQIRAAFAARGNTRPTDDQVLRAYWTSKNAK